MTLLFQWLPPLLFPDGQPGLQRRRQDSLTAFFWGLRRQAARDPSAQPVPVDLGYLYFALCILSASAANQRTLAFYAGLCGLAGLGALVLALAPVLAALVGAAGAGRGRRGLRRPHRAPPAPAEPRADGVRVHLQSRPARHGPVPGDDGHRPSREPQVLRSDRSPRRAARRAVRAVPPARGDLRHLQLVHVARLRRRLHRNPARRRRRDVEVRDRARPGRASDGFRLISIAGAASWRFRAARSSSTVWRSSASAETASGR